MNEKNTKPASESKTISSANGAIISVAAIIVVMIVKKALNIDLDQMDVATWIADVVQIGFAAFAAFCAARAKIHRKNATHIIKDK